MPSWLKAIPQSRSERVVAGIDEDDCAVLRLGQALLIVTADYLNARPIALELGLGGLEDLGRLNVLANLSDLCGTGAEPQAFMSAITMPREASQEDFEQVMNGIVSECRKWGIPLVGGDTKLGASMALLGIAIGSAKSEENLTLKRNAKVGDLIWLSGAVGGCNAAVLSLVEDIGVWGNREWAADAILRPNLPLGYSREVSEGRLGHGGIDISDGLGNDLYRLARASGVGLRIHADNIPVSTEIQGIAKKIGVPAWAFSFGAGGDMQFVVTSPTKHAIAMESIGLSCIGEVLQEGQMTLEAGGVVGILPSGGHRDARRVSFAEEIRSLVISVAEEFNSQREKNDWR